MVDDDFIIFKPAGAADELGICAGNGQLNDGVGQIVEREIAEGDGQTSVILLADQIEFGIFAGKRRQGRADPLAEGKNPRLPVIGAGEGAV